MSSDGRGHLDLVGAGALLAHRLGHVVALLLVLGLVVGVGDLQCAGYRERERGLELPLVTSMGGWGTVTVPHLRRVLGTFSHFRSGTRVVSVRVSSTMLHFRTCRHSK